MLIWRGAGFVLGANRKPRSSRSMATPRFTDGPVLPLGMAWTVVARRLFEPCSGSPCSLSTDSPELRGNCTGYGRRARIRSAILNGSDSERLGGDQRTPLPRNRRGARDFPGPFISAKIATPNAHSCCSDHWCHAPEALTPFPLGHLAWRRLGQYGRWCRLTRHRAYPGRGRNTPPRQTTVLTLQASIAAPSKVGSRSSRFLWDQVLGRPRRWISRGAPLARQERPGNHAVPFWVRRFSLR